MDDAADEMIPRGAATVPRRGRPRPERPTAAGEVQTFMRIRNFEEAQKRSGRSTRSPLLMRPSFA